MNILLTGSNGFLGQIIMNILGREHQIFGLSRNSGNYKVSLDTQIPTFSHAFDIVIHAAGKAHSVPKNDIEKQEFYKTNVIGTKNLLLGLENTSLPKQFIFISSVSVYGQEIGDNINEDHSLDAKDPYGVSKINAEKIILDWCEENKIICTILRLPLLIGKNPPGNLGAMIRAINEGYYFNIDGGRAHKSMVLAEDVAAFIPKLASIDGVYNLTDGIHPNFYELSKAISKQKNKKLPFNLPIIIAKCMALVGDLIGVNAPINSPKLKRITSNLTFDDTKAIEQLAWKPQNVLMYLRDNELE
ncbi:NAD(P)-dependent oxidoreductase [Flavobacterium sp. LM4]|uniref:NAD-dependent epimerase/dehydratase family protein n=1 Tax=Flavobacterium sp. LM4 TaxID=1938609 RepID=UPI0009931FC4|nr:NAD-dependent epimerase/dehydratase family protein [Flavobacterium sp. LM4]OOV18366.1 UDP-galactose-4-epimerase [Flavobacterium sp. LM4]